jgi:hypothetical protein
MSNFIWTEIYNCGKIGNVALKSFVKFHPNLKVHVFGFEDDFNFIIKSDNIIPIVFKKNLFFRFILCFLPKKISNLFFDINISHFSLEDGFRNGHVGTARLWAFIIQSRKEKNLIHFDSDVIFRDNILEEMIFLGEKYDIVGPIRNYKNNPNKSEFFEDFNNVSSTYCF